MLEALGIQKIDDLFIFDVATQRFRVMINTVIAVITRGYDHSDGFAFGPAEAGLAEHDRHVQIEMVAHRVRVKAVNLEYV